MLQGLPAPQRRPGHQLPLLLCEHVEKDGAVSSVLLRVFVPRRRPRMAARRVPLPGAVPVPRLSAPLPLRQRRVPLIRRLPVPYGLIARPQLLRQLPQAYLLAPAFPCDIFSLGGVALLAPLRHVLPPRARTNVRPSGYENTPRVHARYCVHGKGPEPFGPSPSYPWYQFSTENLRKLLTLKNFFLSPSFAGALLHLSACRLK